MFHAFGGEGIEGEEKSISMKLGTLHTCKCLPVIVSVQKLPFKDLGV